MDVKLAFLGTGTCNAASRNPSSLLLSSGEDMIAVDFGGGAYHQISRLNSADFHYKEISTIFLTHFHMDHISGLPDFFWGSMWDVSGRREKPLHLVGPHGLNNFYSERLLPFMGDYPLPFDVVLHEIADGETYTGTFYSTTAYHLSHGDFSSGYLFEMTSMNLAVTGDTGYCDKLLSLLEKSQTTVMEWSIADFNTYPGHISSSDIIKLIKTDALPDRIYITHMYLPEGVSHAEQVLRNRDLLGEHENRFIFPDDLDIIKLTRSKQ